MIEIERLKKDIEAGKEVKEFLSSALGKKLMASCRARKVDAVNELLTVSPSDVGRISALQAIVAECSFVEKFFEGCYADAELAEQRLEQDRYDFSF